MSDGSHDGRDGAPQPMVEVLTGIPPLAWLVDLSGARRILAGRGVDVRELPGRLEVSEGCWEGDFATSSIAEARHLFGSGFVVEGDDVLFCAAAHTLEALYAYRNGGRRIVSNSLAFLVRYAGIELDPEVRIYPKALTIVQGLKAYDPLIYRKGGEEIFRFAYCNFRFGATEIDRADKPLPPRFGDYPAYRDYVSGVLRGMRDNAAAAGRRRSYRMVTSISSGYDSSAGAVLAAAAGCDTAVTLRTGKFGTDDSGLAVAEALGLRCVERDRRIGGGDDRFPEADFIASFDPGDSVFSAFADLLPGTLFLTGHHGDGLWDADLAPNDSIKRKDSSGMGLHEFRLRTDFVTVPLVFVGATRHSDIREISRSEEMRPFGIGGSYDRPIPRRLLEEAGVPRELFGRDKNAVNIELFHGERQMTAASRRDMEAFVARRARPLRRAQESMFGMIRYAADVGLGRVDSGLSRSVSRRPRLNKLARRVDWHLRRNWGARGRPYFSYVLIWALTRVGERYASA
uniref:hypothetical protein n=1 Tax=uncultured Amaricoccus sp. TaxID=339341 RepID=UPI00260F24D7